MNSPKTLHWLASTAGIPLTRAEQLWISASDSAQQVTGEAESARHLGIAHEQMVALVEKEVLGAQPVEATPWLMIQAHLSVLPLVVANTLARAATALGSALGRQLGTPANCSH